MDCQRCNGIGYIAVFYGDNDVECPTCKCTGTLPEALYTVSQSAHGVKMNYFTEYLPAILLVNETWPHEGSTVEDDCEPCGETWAEWKLAQSMVNVVRLGDGL